MDSEPLISSDDSNDAQLAVSKRATRATRKNAKPISYDVDLTSDSEEGEIEFKKTKDDQPEKFLGEISLLTSDEEYIPESPKPKKRAAKAAKKTVSAPRKKKPKTIEILTSDEEENVCNPVKPPATGKKRKLSQANDDGIPKPTPPKKTKTTPKVKKPTQRKPRVTKKAAAAKLPAEKAAAEKCDNNIVTPNTSIDISMEEIHPVWEEYQLLAEKTQMEEEIARNLIKLWEEGNTIPFIARYRKNVIGNMSADDLREAKEVYDDIFVLKKKMCTVVKAVLQVRKMDNKLQANICAARSLEELEHIYAPFKPGPKASLAEKAKKCGLEEPALHILNNTSMINFWDYVNPDVDDLKTQDDVKKGIMHIIASEMATDPALLTFLRELRGRTWFRLQTKKARQVKAKETTTLKSTKKKGSSNKDLKAEELKFEKYIDFNQRTDYLRSHQILAINRGESLKFLSVKIEIPEWFEKQFEQFCSRKWVNKSRYDFQRQDIMQLAIKDAFQRLITPLITREIRADLKQKAEKESCKVFSDNLKHLLLIPPMKGKAILGIDPGYTNGCKLALISPTGSLLAQNVVYPHNNKNSYRGESVIKDMLIKHRCNLIAIGNGTACRQTEEWISDLIQSHYFGTIGVQYTIVNEDGASIYSCSAEARKEFDTLDPNIISAVSLARRIQDPMAELVKVEPCHLGIGMYQLDIKKKQLEEALNEVVSECVSFVGVDLNTASQCLLRRVAGLSDKRATQIIDHRERNGPFTHRRQLLDVFGIGERIFEQCAGFLRVGPTDPTDVNFYKKGSTTPLDATIIHPESYPVVRSLLGKMDLKERDVGTDYFIRSFKVRSQEFNIENLAQTFQTDKQTIQLIFDALSKNLNHDLRTEVSKTPLFKSGVTTLEDLETGTIVTGRVKNVTSFGAFIDIGVQRDGLLHNKFMKGLTVHLGDVMEVKVTSIDIVKGHIQLEAMRKIN